MVSPILIYAAVNIFVFALFYYGGIFGFAFLVYYECRNSDNPQGCYRDQIYVTVYRIAELTDDENVKIKLLERCRKYPTPVCERFKKAKGWI